MILARRRRGRASRGAAGHTLFELLTVIVIIAVLLSIAQRGSAGTDDDNISSFCALSRLGDAKL